MSSEPIISGKPDELGDFKTPDVTAWKLTGEID